MLFTSTIPIYMIQNCLLSQGLRGIWLWTVTLFSFALFLRGEEPLHLKLKNLRLPADYQRIACLAQHCSIRNIYHILFLKANFIIYCISIAFISYCSFTTFCDHVKMSQYCSLIGVCIIANCGFKSMDHSLYFSYHILR